MEGVLGDGGCDDAHENGHGGLMYVGYFSELYDMGGEDVEDEDDDEDEGFDREGFDHRNLLL